MLLNKNLHINLVLHSLLVLSSLFFSFINAIIVIFCSTLRARFFTFVCPDQTLGLEWTVCNLTYTQFRTSLQFLLTNPLLNSQVHHESLTLGFSKSLSFYFSLWLWERPMFRFQIQCLHQETSIDLQMNCVQITLVLFNPYTFFRKGKFYHNFDPFINSLLWLGNQLLDKGRELFD